MESLKQKSFPYRFYVLRGFAIFFITVIIKSVMGLFVAGVYLDMKMNVGNVVVEIPYRATMLIYFVGTVLLFNSMLNLFATYDKRLMHAFLDADEDVALRRTFSKILRSRELWVECATVMTLTLFATLVGWFPEISGTFSSLSLPEPLLFWLPAIVMLPLTLLLSLWRRYEAYRYWSHLYRAGKIDRLYRISRLVFRAIILVLNYIVCFPYFPMWRRCSSPSRAFFSCSSIFSPCSASSRQSPPSSRFCSAFTPSAP